MVDERNLPLPGISTIDIGSGQSKPLIRELGFNRVVIAEHGVKHEAQQWGTDHGLEIDQFAVERLEVIKGPASLQYGSDAIGGLIEASQVMIPGVGYADYHAKTGFFANAHGIMPLTTDYSYDQSVHDIQVPFQWVNHVKAILRVVSFQGKRKTEVDLGWQYNFRRELNQYYQHGYMPPVLPDTLGFQADLADPCPDYLHSLLPGGGTITSGY